MSRQRGGQVSDDVDVPTGASAPAIRHHYDLGNDFYRLWLDEEMVYSCALWSPDAPDEDLAAAQQRKLRYHLTEAAPQGARSLLDVGCGWGAMLRFAVTAGPTEHALGLTLSPAQAEWIRSHARPGVEVRVASWHDHVPQEPHDAIVSIGAFEHFARPGDSREEKIRIYRRFFESCHSWLRPHGRLSLQTIALPDDAPPPTDYIEAQAFPESQVPRLREILEATDGMFELLLLRNDRGMYARTSREWARRLRARRTDAEPLVGAATVDRYLEYLRVCAFGFDLGKNALLRLTLQRIG
jgi:cyclopropane-fatty-acyl-phospholipid synthase